MTALDVLQQLHELGVLLTPFPDESMRYRAPKGVLTPAMVDGMRQHNPELHTLVEEGCGVGGHRGSHRRIGRRRTEIS